MKKTILLFVLLSQLSFSQKVNFDFVIHIDQQTIEKVYDVSVKIDEIEIPMEYHPGCLLIDKDNFEKIKLSKTCVFKFRNLDSSRSPNYVSYEFEIDGNWFYSKYIVLEVFDMSNRKSRRKFRPLPNKSYTFFLSNGNRYIIPTSR